MKLNVDFSTKEEKPQEEYEIVLNFMENDADGYEQVHFSFGKEKLEDPEFMKELEEFLICTNECLRKDARGRGGFMYYGELIDEYNHIPNWYKFCSEAFEDVEDDELIDIHEMTQEEVDYIRNGGSTYFSYMVPTYSDGWFDSYEDMDIYYYDENGDRFPVTVDYETETA
jgi:hypothetical protein